MAKEVTPRAYLVIVAAVFLTMVVVTLVVFLAVERASHHVPGARPDLPVTVEPTPDPTMPDSPSDHP